MEPLLEMLGATPEEVERYIRPWALRQAALHFEAAGARRDAAECWAELGELARAAELYAEEQLPAEAAPLLLRLGRLDEAAAAYRAWGATLPTGDTLNRARYHLGLAACGYLGVAGTPGKAAREARRAAALVDYQAARALIEDDAARDGLLAGRCWEALGEYGVTLERYDLIQVGYEMALRRYGERYNAERVRAGRVFLGLIGWNRLLTADLATRLALWEPERGPLKAWERLKAELEAPGFVGDARDVLHFADEERQLAAWSALASLVDDPDQPQIDAYLREFAPEGMVYIPAGPFVMGTTEKEITELLANTTNDTLRMVLQTEQPQHEVLLAGYYIGRTPVTNAEFAAFVEATGHRTEAETGGGGWVYRQGWQQEVGADWRHPDGPESSIAGKERHPVVQVSWNDAVAYCAWRGGRLPTEAEWEKAAGWDADAQRKRRYPWDGDWDAGKCNINRPNDGTTPVGAYSPAGDSPYGCADMAGNVFQWCSTRWGTSTDQPDYRYPYVADDGREDPGGGNEMLRIMRGASWATGVAPVSQWARCGYRGWDVPGNWYDTWGLRLVAPRHLLVLESSGF